MNLYIKNMVSIRCKMIVKAELDQLRLRYTSVESGQVIVKGDVAGEKLDQLKTALLKSGLELMDNKKAILIEKIKNVVIEMVHYADEIPMIKFSYYLSKKLNYDYTYLANIFSEVTGVTIEHFVIAHKIEKAKELMLYENLTLTQVANRLHYSSVAHLSMQFKKVTGLTPTFFKHLKQKRLIALQNAGTP